MSIFAWFTGSNATKRPVFPASILESSNEIEIKIPEHEEQTAISTILTDMDAEVAALEAKKGKPRKIRQGMMQELLTGRIRLV
jgi:type I restriction enzyme S subunit